MANYDFTDCLSALDFELLSKDLLEAELGIQLENFSEGRDKGIDLRYAPTRGSRPNKLNAAKLGTSQKPPKLIVQCKRYSKFADLKNSLKNNELPKITKLNPSRYILTTSVSLSPQQVDQLKMLLSPFVQSTGDIYGRERINSIIIKHPEIERRHIKLWVTSAGVLDTLINAGTHVVSHEEVVRTIASAKIYVQNPSFDEALKILKNHRVCIIAGQGGIGKTTMARMLLLYYYERKFDIVKIEGDIKEASAVGYHNKPRFYYYDDFLGQTAQADKLGKNEDQRLLDFMTSVRDSENSVFVLTTREYILNQASLFYEKLAREKFAPKTCIIDLTTYSRRIRAQILYNHLHFSKLPKAHLEALVASRGYVKIVDHKNYNPRIIEHLTDSAWIQDIPAADYVKMFLQKLDNPVEIWEHAFRNQLSDKARHLLFIITTMPTESRYGDLEKAFISFHNSQCLKFGLPHSATDFKTALKILDGTFVSTREVQGSVLVGFQNPSIRDFMKYLLLGGEQLQEIIASLVFFEQAMWFMNTLVEKQTKVSTKELECHESKIADALQRLFDAESCSVIVFSNQSLNTSIWLQVAEPAKRLATVANAIVKQTGRSDNELVFAKMSELSTKVEAGELNLASFVRPIKELSNLGFLVSESGKNLASALKRRTMSMELKDLDDFEITSELATSLTELYSESDLDSVKGTFSAFAAKYANECDLDDPNEIRDEAMRMRNISQLLKIDTNFAQEALNEFADELEKEEEYDRDDDDDRRGSSSPEMFSDSDLDSMFGTLRK